VKRYVISAMVRRWGAIGTFNVERFAVDVPDDTDPERDRGVLADAFLIQHGRDYELHHVAGVFVVPVSNHHS
jgi:hypothetical protein